MLFEDTLNDTDPRAEVAPSPLDIGSLTNALPMVVVPPREEDID